MKEIQVLVLVKVGFSGMKNKVNKNESSRRTGVTNSEFSKILFLREAYNYNKTLLWCRHALWNFY